MRATSHATDAAAVKRSRLLAALGYATAYAAVGAAAPYFPVYYESLGMTLDAIGLLAGVAALTGMFAAPAWGILSDRLAGSRYVLTVACLASATAGTLLGLATTPVVAALFAVVYYLSFAAVGPLLDTRALETVGDDHAHFSRLRVWGSASFIGSTLFVGWLIERTEIRVIFVALVAATLATAVVAMLATGGRPRGPALPRFSGLRAVAASRPLMAFVAVALAAWSSSTAVNGFMSIYLIDIGAPGSLVGMAWAIGATVEVPLMIAFPVLARRVGLEPLIVAGAAFLLLRVLALLVVHDPVLVALAMTLHGAGFALLLVGGVAYAARHAPPGAAATAQGVLAGVTVGLAQAIGPTVGGTLARAIGIPQMFAVAAVCSALAAVALGWVVLRPALRSPLARTEADIAR